MTRIIRIMGLSVVLLLVLMSGVLPARAATPEGMLVVGMPISSPWNFLPWIASGQQAIWQNLVYDNLFYNNMKTGELIPGLAKRFEMSKDALNITVWLREGVPWQNPRYGEVTADDVKYTYERCIAKDSAHLMLTDLRKIKTIKVLDAHTLVFQLNEPDPVFWLNLTIRQCSYTPIVCKRYIEAVGEAEADRNPMGSGPYRLVEYKSGEFLKVEALKQHWRVVPEFKYITLKVVHEDSTLVAMLKTGELDVAPISSFKLRELQEAGIGASLWPGGYPVFLSFGGMVVPEDYRYVKGYSRSDPWVDIRVREAMNIAIDREAIIKAIYKGGATPTTLWVELPGSEELEPYPYDPKRAKRLLAEAGFPNGFSFKVYTKVSIPGQELRIVAEAVAGYWEAIGLSPKMVHGDRVGMLEMVKSGKDVGYVWVFAGGWQADYTQRVVAYNLPKGAYNFYQDEELIRLIRRIPPELDYKKRTAMWREVAKYMHDNYTVVATVIARPAWGYNSKKIKVDDWPKNPLEYPLYLEYIRHAEPLNTPRLFTP
jgi:peptide/nickel transport system substrate-binding protein